MKLSEHFDSSEFDSPDEPGSGERIDMSLVWVLEYIRGEVGFPIVITSGVRTKAHNLEVGGVDGSAHVYGFAADIHCRTSGQRMAIIKAAIKSKVRRIGIAKTFVHIDVSPDEWGFGVRLPQDVIWLY